MLRDVHVALFISCLTDTFYPRVGEATVRVLRHYGCEVSFPLEQTCCGQPAHNAGFMQDAALVGGRFLDIFSKHPTIVTPSASCAAMVREHLPRLFARDVNRSVLAREVASRTHELTCFLREIRGVNIAGVLRPKEPITYHYPCHARHVYSVDALEETLRGDGSLLRQPEKRDLCCGFGGTFAVDHGPVSAGMVEDRLRDLQASGASLVICNEGGCTLQLAGAAHRRGMPLRFRHVVELLAESLGLMECER